MLIVHIFIYYFSSIFILTRDFQLAKDVTERDKIEVHKFFSDLEELNISITVHALNLLRSKTYL